MLTAKEPYPTEQLPLKQKNSTDLAIFEQKIMAAVKAQMVNVVNNKAANFDDAIRDIVAAIFYTGYNKGLADMDKMHKRIDAMIATANK